MFWLTAPKWRTAARNSSQLRARSRAWKPSSSWSHLGRSSTGRRARAAPWAGDRSPAGRAACARTPADRRLALHPIISSESRASRSPPAHHARRSRVQRLHEEVGPVQHHVRESPRDVPVVADGHEGQAGTPRRSRPAWASDVGLYQIPGGRGRGGDRWRGWVGRGALARPTTQLLLAASDGRKPRSSSASREIEKAHPRGRTSAPGWTASRAPRL